LYKEKQKTMRKQKQIREQLLQKCLLIFWSDNDMFTAFAEKAFPNAESIQYILLGLCGNATHDHFCLKPSVYFKTFLKYNGTQRLSPYLRQSFHRNLLAFFNGKIEIDLRYSPFPQLGGKEYLVNDNNIFSRLLEWVLYLLDKCSNAYTDPLMTLKYLWSPPFRQRTLDLVHQLTFHKTRNFRKFAELNNYEDFCPKVDKFFTEVKQKIQLEAGERAKKFPFQVVKNFVFPQFIRKEKILLGELHVEDSHLWNVLDFDRVNAVDKYLPYDVRMRQWEQHRLNCLYPDGVHRFFIDMSLRPDLFFVNLCSYTEMLFDAMPYSHVQSHLNMVKVFESQNINENNIGYHMIRVADELLKLKCWDPVYISNMYPIVEMQYLHKRLTWPDFIETREFCEIMAKACYMEVDNESFLSLYNYLETDWCNVTTIPYSYRNGLVEKAIALTKDREVKELENLYKSSPMPADIYFKRQIITNGREIERVYDLCQLVHSNSHYSCDYFLGRLTKDGVFHPLTKFYNMIIDNVDHGSARPLLLWLNGSICLNGCICLNSCICLNGDGTEDDIDGVRRRFTKLYEICQNAAEISQSAAEFCQSAAEISQSAAEFCPSVDDAVNDNDVPEQNSKKLKI
jgi:hypothetical protein